MDAAVESWIPFWEVVWILRPLFSGQSDDQILPFARTSLKTLIGQGYLYLAWLDDQTSGSEESIVSGRDIDEVLAARDNWHVAKSISRPHLVIAATPEGFARFETLLQTRSS